MLVFSQGSTRAFVKNFCSSLCFPHNVGVWILQKPTPGSPSSTPFLFCPHHKLSSRPPPPPPTAEAWKEHTLVDVATARFLLQHRPISGFAPHGSSRSPSDRQRTEAQSLTLAPLRTGRGWNPKAGPSSFSQICVKMRLTGCVC